MGKPAIFARQKYFLCSQESFYDTIRTLIRALEASVQKTDFVPKIAVVLAPARRFGDSIELKASLNTRTLTDFPFPTHPDTWAVCLCPASTTNPWSS